MRQEFDLKIIEKKVEALDAVTLKLEVPTAQKDKFKPKAGQFIGVTAEINGEEVHRSYSLSSGPESDLLEISIKKIPGGKMSTHLVDVVKAGETLKVVPPTGHFYKESENKKHHVMFAAGSGVTPMLSVIKYLKEEKPKEQVSLFYWNQTSESSMFLDELIEMDKSPMFNLFLAFTKEKTDFEQACFFERCNQAIMKDCFYKWSVSIDMPVFYLCGPDEFMGSVELFLGSKGYDPSQIRKESFNTSGSTAVVDISVKGDVPKGGPIYVGDMSVKTDEKGGLCEAILDGDTISVSPNEDETILEAFLRDGESPPYSCMEGTCIACQCKVLEGLVSMPEGSFISDEDIADGLVLSCQAQIKSKHVKIDFDDF